MTTSEQQPMQITIVTVLAGHRCFSATGLNSQNPGLSEFLSLTILVSILFILLNKSKKKFIPPLLINGGKVQRVIHTVLTYIYTA